MEKIMIEQTEEACASMNGLVKKLAGKQIQKMVRLFDGLYKLSDEEAMKKKVGGGTTLYYFKEMGEHATADYLAKNQKPMLIMQGAKDFQVKVDKDFFMYQELLKNQTNVTFKLYENLNHAFVPSVYGSITKAKQEYNVEQHIGEEVIGDIARWILEVCAEAQ